MLPFIEEPGSGSEEANYAYDDPATGRSFNVRLLLRAHIMDVVAGNVDEASTRSRYFLEEFTPNGVMVHPEDDSVARPYLLPNWREVRGRPSTAYAAIAKVRATLGFEPVRAGGGLGMNSIYYDTLEEASRQIEIGIETDMWVVSYEPVKRYSLGLRSEIDFDAKSVLDTMPGEDQIRAAIAEVISRLNPHEHLIVSEHCGTIRLEVSDKRLEYPDNARLCIGFDRRGCVAGHRFVRRGWEEFADRLAGERVARYDEPENYIRTGLPMAGQSISGAVGCGPAPERIARVEVLRKLSQRSNKIYADVVVDGEHWLVWGRFPSGALQARRTQSSYSCMLKLHEKRDEGYVDIDGESIPDFWNRILTAVEKRKNVEA